MTITELKHITTMTSKQIKEKGLRMFSLLITIEDFKLLEVIKREKRFTTYQQAVKYLMYNDAKLLDFAEPETITLSN